MTFVSPDGKLACDLGNVFEVTRIGGRQSDRLLAGKLSSGNFGLLQQYLPIPDLSLLDNLVGGHLHDQRHRETKRPGSFEIDDEVEPRRLHHR